MVIGHWLIVFNGVIFSCWDFRSSFNIVHQLSAVVYSRSTGRWCWRYESLNATCLGNWSINNFHFEIPDNRRIHNISDFLNSIWFYGRSNMQQLNTWCCFLSIVISSEVKYHFHDWIHSTRSMSIAWCMMLTYKLCPPMFMFKFIQNHFPEYNWVWKIVFSLLFFTVLTQWIIQSQELEKKNKSF